MIQMRVWPNRARVRDRVTWADVLTGAHIIGCMTVDERAQLVEDIKKSDRLRRGIIERAELDREFDILAAWEEVEKIDDSINKRVVAARRA